MSNYLKTTNFTAKDSLPSGNAAKKIVGAEFDAEFTGIQTAVATKADLDSPTFTGTPLAPTAAFGTDSTQLATTAFVQAALAAIYPVGTIYTSTVATNPAVTFGFGTWEAFGAGRVLVGQNTSDTSFDTLEETGGSKNAIVVSHSHPGTTNSAGGHSHTFAGSYNGNFDYTAGNFQGIYPSGSYPTSSAGNHTHSFSTDTIGSSGTNANLQPYVVVKMWKRTA